MHYELSITLARAFCFALARGPVQKTSSGYKPFFVTPYTPSINPQPSREVYGLGKMYASVRPLIGGTLGSVFSISIRGRVVEHVGQTAAAAAAATAAAMPMAAEQSVEKKQ